MAPSLEEGPQAGSRGQDANAKASILGCLIRKASLALTLRPEAICFFSEKRNCSLGKPGAGDRIPFHLPWGHSSLCHFSPKLLFPTKGVLRGSSSVWLFDLIASGVTVKVGWADTWSPSCQDS